MLPLVGSFASRLMCAVDVPKRPLKFVPCCAPVNATLLVSGTTFHSPENATALHASPAAETQSLRRRVRFMVFSDVRLTRMIVTLYRSRSRARSTLPQLELSPARRGAGAMLEFTRPNGRRLAMHTINALRVAAACALAGLTACSPQPSATSSLAPPPAEEHLD